MIGKLCVGVHAERARPSGGVLQPQIPQLYVLPSGDEEGLGRVQPAPRTLIDGVAQAVTAAVVLQSPAAGLPRHGPEFPGLVVPEVEVVSGAVYGHAVGPEAGNPVVLRAFIEEIPPRRVVHHGAQGLYAQIVGPGYRHVHTVDDVLPLLLVKVAVFHGGRPPIYSIVIILYWNGGRKLLQAMCSFDADCQLGPWKLGDH